MVSNTSYKPKVTLEKKDELLQLLQGYWINDVWNLRDNFFEVYDSKEFACSNCFFIAIETFLGISLTPLRTYI